MKTTDCILLIFLLFFLLSRHEAQQPVKDTQIHTHSHSRPSQTSVLCSVPVDEPTSASSVDSVKASQSLSVLAAGPANGSFLWLLWNKTNTSLGTPSHSPAAQHAAEKPVISSSAEFYHLHKY